MKRNTQKILYIVAGVLAIVLAACCFFKYDGSWEASEYYGGDAYTGIQQAAAQTANNVQDLSRIAKFGFGSILLVSGISLFGAAAGIPKVQAMGDVPAPSVNVKTAENVADSKSADNCSNEKECV